MKTYTKLKSSILIILFISIAVPSIKAQPGKKYGILSYNTAINVSGKQRMLTQKMTKAYLYLINNPTDMQAKKDLLTSKIMFEKKNSILLDNTKNKNTKASIEKVHKLWGDFKKIIEETPSFDGATKIMETNTDLLKAANSVVLAIIAESKDAIMNNAEGDEDFDEELANSRLELKKIINISGRQRMLSQRLAGYYYANQSALKDKNLKAVLNQVFNELDGAINLFVVSDFNTTEIDEKLGSAVVQWEYFKANSKKLFGQGFDDTDIYKRSNKLTKIFDDITGLYEKVDL
ncbi:type IV pili methyl-accepting chemotaxis transducer N-terminal domain-containing protein [Aquimarina pacifica]|uniref:type IV pili methyl-accepting chemotaxis transducer N-terminal domain-containing protein n=1 Tax=Aquimarina pacifica TaxID=1296415 RepID=UPI00047258B8|nr:type IV pili methyl-accepting chemotaxis transducer N-terminal domain-containing protein [Aquimarina pacifica]